MVCDSCILCELENNWDALQTQTSWVLEKPTADNISSNETSNDANTAPKSNSAKEDPVLENNDGSTEQEQSAGEDDSQTHQADVNPCSSADLPSHSQAENEAD